MPRMSRRAAAVALVLVFAFAARAADDVLTAYTEALKLARAGEPDKAVALYRDLLAANPDHKLADDILYQIAATSERHLYDYPAAREAYAALVERFPQSNHVRRAKAALQRLKDSAVAGDVPLAAFNAVLAQYYRVGAEESLARMEKLMADYPDVPFAERAWTFIAEERLRLERFDGAIQAYLHVMRTWPSPLNETTGWLALANAYAERRDLDAAQSAYEKLAEYASTNEFAAAASADGLRRVRDFRIMRRLFVVCLAIVVVYAAFAAWLIDWRGARWSSVASIWPEALILLLVVGGTLTAVRDRGMTFITGIAALMFAGIAMLAGNALVADSPKVGPKAMPYVPFFGILAAVAAIYVTYFATDLANVLWDSLLYEMEYGSLQ
ncbi:tetratricopeptide repeat protein [bacterium]|nr:tetratricopeptide repeat protein [bacterium]